MSYISVVIHKQSDWLVQRQSDKLFNLQKTQTVNLYQRYQRYVCTRRAIHSTLSDSQTKFVTFLNLAYLYRHHY